MGELCVQNGCKRWQAALSQHQQLPMGRTQPFQADPEPHSDLPAELMRKLSNSLSITSGCRPPQRPSLQLNNFHRIRYKMSNVLSKDKAVAVIERILFREIETDRSRVSSPAPTCGTGVDRTQWRMEHPGRAQPGRHTTFPFRVSLRFLLKRDLCLSQESKVTAL